MGADLSRIKANEKYLKTPSSVIGMPEYKLPDYLDDVSFSDPTLSRIFRLIDTNSKIGRVLFVDDFLESDKVVKIMTADEYKEMHEKTKLVLTVRTADAK